MTKQRAIPKPAVVLRLLLEGAIIEYDRRFWVMGEGGRMGCAAVDDSGEMIPPNEEGNITVLYVLDDALENFIQWAEKLPDEVIFSAACELILREINQAGGLTAWSATRD